MRRKDLTLHHGLVRADPVAAFGFTWSPEDADTDRKPKLKQSRWV